MTDTGATKATEQHGAAPPPRQLASPQHDSGGEHGDYFYDYMRNGVLHEPRLFRELLLGEMSPGHKLASFHSAVHLSFLARSLEDADAAEVATYQSRWDWARLNAHFSAVKPVIKKAMATYNLTFDALKQGAVPGLPKICLRFESDGVLWEGKLELRVYPGKADLRVLKVTLPCDGFLVTAPSVCQVKPLGVASPAEHTHRTYRHHPIPEWTKIDPRVSRKVPTIRAFTTAFFKRTKDVFVFSCVDEQRVDIEAHAENVDLVVQFEVGLPVSRPRAVPQNGEEAAAARLWDESEDEEEW
mgnify:CR=1 FL=1